MAKLILPLADGDDDGVRRRADSRGQLSKENFPIALALVAAGLTLPTVLVGQRDLFAKNATSPRPSR